MLLQKYTVVLLQLPSAVTYLCTLNTKKNVSILYEIYLFYFYLIISLCIHILFSFTLVSTEMIPLPGDDSRDICDWLYAACYPDRPTHLMPVRSLV